MLGLAFSPSGRYLAAAHAGGVLVLDLELDRLEEIAAAPRRAADFHVCAAGRLLVRSEANGTPGYALWDLPDAVTPTPGHRTDAELRRWVAVMCGSVGRRAANGSVSTARRAGPPRGLGGGSAPAPGFTWLSGGAAVAETRPGRLVRHDTAEPDETWSAEVPAGAFDVEASAEAQDPLRAGGPGAAVAVASRQGRAPLAVLDAVTGRPLTEVPGGQAPVWCPRGGGLLVVPEAGPAPARLYLYTLGEPPAAAEPVSRFVRGRVGRPGWSPDGRLLAAGTQGEVLLWRMPEFTLTRPRLRMPTGAFATRVAWSPDGTRLAATPQAEGGSIVVWDTGDWRIRREFGAPGGVGWAPALAWSPDGALLAAPGPGLSTSVVQIWDVAEAAVVLVLEPPEPADGVWSVRWSPDGRRIAITYRGGGTLLWPLSEPGAPAGPLPLPGPRLAELGSAAAQAEAAAPLSALVALHSLVGPPTGAGEGRPAELLWGSRAAQELAALGWRAEARAALAAVTATRLPPDARCAAPPGVPGQVLRAALERGLGGSAQGVPERAPGTGVLAAALERTRAELLPALRLLGPDAVARDPGLADRVARALGAPRRDRDGRRPVPWLRRPAAAPGDDVTGPTAAGAPSDLVRHGPPDRMLPSHLALPAAIRATLQEQGALLYRTRGAAAPQAAGDAVLVLDTGPAAHGDVGTCLRVCAHRLAQALAEAGRAVELLQLNGLDRPVPLTGTAGLRRLWAPAPPAPPDPERAARHAARALRRLGAGAGAPPRPVLLTHPHQRRLPLPGLLTIRVHYSGAPTASGERDTWTLAPDPAPERLGAVIDAVLAEL
ncbi:hypothetical protein [Streptomyces sp. NPDC060194]|uniref:hypothetical protein n=1 Tax=Streptomyces sp. NPDC060194 TaxID=3347069 RepID=UPI003669A883